MIRIVDGVEDRTRIEARPKGASNGSADLRREKERGHAEGHAVLRRATCQDTFRRPERAASGAGRAEALHSKTRHRSIDRSPVEAFRRSWTRVCAIVRRTLAREARRGAAALATAARAEWECADDWTGRRRLEGLDGEVTQLSVSKVTVEFGSTVLFRDVTFTVSTGERWGVIGRNGTGKTTLF